MDLNYQVSDISTSRSSRRRVTRQHTLERVRDNQRRHRARRRDHVAELERKLVDAVEHVASLQKKVETLEDDLSRWQRQSVPVASDTATLFLTNPSQSPGTSACQRVTRMDTFVTPQDLYQDPCHDPAISSLLELDSATPLRDSGTEKSFGITQSTPEFSIHGSHDWSDFQWNASSVWQEIGPHELTTPCSEAYLLITQQNYKGLGEDEIATRLSHGFRKPGYPGDGCHVRTDILFCLIAFISETDQMMA